MSNQTQQEIDALIQYINDTEEPETVTNVVVATILAFLSEKVKGVATEAALQAAINSFNAQFETCVKGSDLETYIAYNLAKLDGNGALNWHESPVVMLATMGAAFDNVDGELPAYTLQEGDMYYNDTSGFQIHKKTSGPDGGYPAKNGVVYINMRTWRAYKWTGSEMAEIAKVKKRFVLADLHTQDYPSMSAGDMAYDPVNKKIVEKFTVGWRLTDPDPDILYCDAQTNTTLRWDATNKAWIQVGGGSSVDVVNNLNTNDGTKALSAKQGKILKANIVSLNGNINALREALANIAFTELPKPAMSELDWDGDKCSVTINNSLTGCSANKTGTQQVSEGSDLVITITADSGKLLRSVTSSAGVVVIAASKATATITLSNVMADTTLNIEANATTKGSFSATISDQRVSGTGAASGISEGSAWESILSLNNTAEEDAAITSVAVEMAGRGEIHYNLSTGKVSTEFVTGNITITVTVAVVGKVEVTTNAIDGTLTSVSSAPSVGTAGEIVYKATPIADYGIKDDDIVVKLDGVVATKDVDYTLDYVTKTKTITSAANSDHKETFNIVNYVTITINTNASTESVSIDLNCSIYLYKGVWMSLSSDNGKLAISSNANASKICCPAAFIPWSHNTSEFSKLTTYSGLGGTDTFGFSSKAMNAAYSAANQNNKNGSWKAQPSTEPSTYDNGDTYAYMRLCFSVPNILTAYARFNNGDPDAGEYADVFYGGQTTTDANGREHQQTRYIIIDWATRTVS